MPVFDSFSIQGETHALEDPVGNVLGGVKVSLTDKAEAHGVAAHGRRVHGGPQRVLQGQRQQTLSRA